MEGVLTVSEQGRPSRAQAAEEPIAGSPWILDGGGGIQTSSWLEGRAHEPPPWPWWGRGLCLPPGDIDHWGRAQPGKVLDAEEGGAPWGRAGQAPFVCRHGLGSAARPGLSLQLYYFRTYVVLGPRPAKSGLGEQTVPDVTWIFKRRD